MSETRHENEPCVFGFALARVPTREHILTLSKNTAAPARRSRCTTQDGSTTSTFFYGVHRYKKDIWKKGLPGSVECSRTL